MQEENNEKRSPFGPFTDGTWSNGEKVILVRKNFYKEYTIDEWEKEFSEIEKRKEKAE